MQINLLLGVPGSGKTTYLINEILVKKILQGVDPNKIFFISFSKSAIKSANDKILDINKNYNFSNILTLKTLHSLAYKYLKNQEDINLMKHEHYHLFYQETGIKYFGQNTIDPNNKDEYYLSLYNLFNNNYYTFNKYKSQIDLVVFEKYKNTYEIFKAKYNLLDYTDLIKKFINNKITIDADIVIIDEAQDLTSLQWLMIFQAFKNCKEIYIAGDDDQALYEWNGADLNFFLNLKTDTIKFLNFSHRLPNLIGVLALLIAQRINKRYTKKILTNKIKYKCVKKINNFEEFEFEKNQRYLILCRNNKLINDYIIKILLQKKLPFHIEGVPYLYNKKEIFLIENWEKFQKDKIYRDINNLKLLPFLKKGININNIEKYNWWECLNIDRIKIEYYRNILKNDLYKNIYIDIRTIHSAKGLEEDNVILFTDLNKYAYENLILNPDAEHRIFYTAVTRTKENLYIVSSKINNLNYILPI